MSNIIKGLLVLFFCTTFLYAQNNKEVSSEELKIINNLKLIKDAHIKVKKALDLGSIYILDTLIEEQHQQELFLTKDKKVLITGKAMDSSTGEYLTIPVDLSKIIGKEAFTYGSGTDEYILFTDPECPYCKKFEAYFPKIEKNVKIRIFFYPLSFHANARELSLYYMSKKTKEEKIKAMLNVTATSEEFKNRKYTNKEYENLEKQLDEQLVIAQALGIQATPTLYNIKGKKVSWIEVLYKYNIK
ncbi:thiol:disulfide interchange protein [Malaciobacter molluscorum LMG 25693]|uniref:Thiol:disulfide interchange protein n=1 Tax=Malaciobacter molluscorum LMG 25693 TaxID=870501 RepID=A0A2G1DGW1_9BACT|nr:thioredoxin fold domain-containing protein [Malaciobacter molluscorum]AXX92289.1 thiol:disulfide interchange protein [Malaciobacter molluscorum LMG 25693]PHO17725.1 thiol:disulfide interchange protein [Malaciobacter molluscorum LMG 25693]RXJ93537.1 thiol:disulfide interchange protein [Malaciobacter molluscorum]